MDNGILKYATTTNPSGTWQVYTITTTTTTFATSCSDTFTVANAYQVNSSMTDVSVVKIVGNSVTNVWYKHMNSNYLVTPIGTHCICVGVNSLSVWGTEAVISFTYEWWVLPDLVWLKTSRSATFTDVGSITAVNNVYYIIFSTDGSSNLGPAANCFGICVVSNQGGVWGVMNQASIPGVGQCSGGFTSLSLVPYGSTIYISGSVYAPATVCQISYVVFSAYNTISNSFTTTPRVVGGPSATGVTQIPVISVFDTKNNVPMWFSYSGTQVTYGYPLNETGASHVFYNTNGDTINGFSIYYYLNGAIDPYMIEYFVSSSSPNTLKWASYVTVQNIQVNQYVTVYKTITISLSDASSNVTLGVVNQMAIFAAKLLFVLAFLIAGEKLVHEIGRGNPPAMAYILVFIGVVGAASVFILDTWIGVLAIVFALLGFRLARGGEASE